MSWNWTIWITITMMMRRNNIKQQHLQKHERIRLFTKTVIPSLLELNRSFEQYLKAINDLHTRMMTGGIRHQASHAHLVSQFLYIYEQKINIGLSRLNAEGDVSINVQSQVLNKRLADIAEQLLCESKDHHSIYPQE